MHESIQSRLEQMLKEYALSALLPVHHILNRPGCSVWQGKLLSRFGDADCQIQLYDFINEPGAIVEFEEEVTSYMDEDYPRRIIKNIRDGQIALLVTCFAQDEIIFARFFKSADPRQAIAYHPQLQRILGADYFHEVDTAPGRWLKATLCSMEKAMQIKDLLKEAGNYYSTSPGWPGKLEFPLPRILAILQVPAKPELEAPPEYDRLALVQSLINSVESIADPSVRETINYNEFARQTFGFLATQHMNGLCYSKDVASCFRPEFLSPNGSLVDAYFINRPPDQTVFKKRVNMDLGNLILTICEVSDDSQVAIQALLPGIKQYLNVKDVTREQLQLVHAAVKGIFTENHMALTALLNELRKYTG